jgi:hypothetical protein
VAEAGASRNPMGRRSFLQGLKLTGERNPMAGLGLARFSVVCPLGGHVRSAQMPFMARGSWIAGGGHVHVAGVLNICATLGRPLISTGGHDSRFAIWRSARDTRAHLRITVPLLSLPAVISYYLKSTQRASQFGTSTGGPGCSDLSRYGDTDGVPLCSGRNDQ